MNIKHYFHQDQPEPPASAQMILALPKRTTDANGRFEPSWVAAKCIFIMVVLQALFACAFLFTPSNAEAARIKDIVSFEGIRSNMLMGYGLVVGLNGTGDRLQNNAFTEQSLIAFLERQGVNTRGSQLKTRNVAAVTVT